MLVVFLSFVVILLLHLTQSLLSDYNPNTTNTNTLEMKL